MGALDNGFRLKADTQPIDGDSLVYDAATDSLRVGGAAPGATGVTKSVAYGIGSGNVATGTALGAGATEIDISLRIQVTVPASGAIIADMSAWVETGASGALYWYPRVVVVSTGAEITKPAIRAAYVGPGASTTKGHITVKRRLSALPVGTLVEVQWQHAATVDGYSVRPDSTLGNQAILTVVTI